MTFVSRKTFINISPLVLQEFVWVIFSRPRITLYIINKTKIRMKRFAYYLLLICLCASVTSCKDDDVHEYITHINYVCTTGNELYTIQSAYQKAYSYDKLVCGYGYNKIYSPSRSVVLNACSLAEDMINNSKVEFKYFYVVEVKEDGEVIYRKSYGNFLQK